MRSSILALLFAVSGAAACSAAPAGPVPEGDAAVAPNASSDGGADAPAPTVHRVEANDFAYQPAKLTIKAGDVVEWVFTAGTHTVTSGKSCTRDNQVDTGVQASPYTFRRTFPDPGVFDYFCSYRQHCQMGQVGRITIEP